MNRLGSWRQQVGRTVWLPMAFGALAVLALVLGLIAFLPEGSPTAQAVEVIDTASLQLMDDRAQITLSGFRYNRATRTYSGTATVTNIAADPLDPPLYLVVATVNPVGASVVGATGLTTTGEPYYDLTPLLSGGILAAGATTSPLTVQIQTPTPAPIQLDLHVYGPVDVVNQAPIADAGPDQTAGIGAIVLLDGSGSHDPDGDLLTFLWSFVAMPPDSAQVLDDPATVNPSFVIDQHGDYQIQLVVNDGNLDSAPDTVRVSTVNSAPVARAGLDWTAQVGDTVILDGSGSSDVDGNPLTYHWSLVSRPPASQAALSDANAVNPTF